MRRLPALLILIAISGGLSGCTMFDFMHPSNTWRLNRGPAMDVSDGYFSVSDPDATFERRNDERSAMPRS